MRPWILLFLALPSPLDFIVKWHNNLHFAEAALNWISVTSNDGLNSTSNKVLNWGGTVSLVYGSSPPEVLFLQSCNNRRCWEAKQVMDFASRPGCLSSTSCQGKREVVVSGPCFTRHQPCNSGQVRMYKAVCYFILVHTEWTKCNLRPRETGYFWRNYSELFSGPCHIGRRLLFARGHLGLWSL